MEDDRRYSRPRDFRTVVADSGISASRLSFTYHYDEIMPYRASGINPVLDLQESQQFDLAGI